MIAAGRRNQAVLQFLRLERFYAIDRTTDLERAADLQTFELEIKFFR